MLTKVQSHAGILTKVQSHAGMLTKLEGPHEACVGV